MLKGFIGLAFAASISVSPIVAAISASTPAHAFCLFFCGGNGGKGGGGVHPVPGPLVGAGLPIIAVGYSAYWLVRRYRRKSDAA